MSDNYDGATGEVIEEAGASGVVREVFGSIEVARQNEVAISAVQARAQAIVQSKYVMALKRPRNPEQVRSDLLKECSRPTFAVVARYRRPQGKRPAFFDDKGVEVPEGTAGARKEWVDNFIEGWSIRFVEAALRALGNVEPATQVLYEDDRKKIVRCEVCDFEKNLSFSQEITIEKTIERRELKRGQVAISQRRNSYNEVVYILPATDDDVRLKENRIISITLRTLSLRLVPGDLLDDALKTVLAAAKKAVTDDPTAARKTTLDNFAAVGVKPTDVAEYLGGRTLEQASPDEILELRAIGAAIKEGELRWPDALAASPYRKRDDSEPKPPAGSASKTQEVKKKIEERVAKAKESKAQKEAAKVKPPEGAQPAAGATTSPQDAAAGQAAASATGPAAASPAGATGPTGVTGAAEPGREPGSDG